MENNEVNGIKKRGRKPKNHKKEFELNKEQTKFFVDMSNEKESLDMIFGFLLKCNEKNYGKPILFKDLCLYSVSKLTDKDIEKIQERSLSKMEKIHRTLEEYNKKHNLSLSLEEFLIKKLGIN